MPAVYEPPPLEHYRGALQAAFNDLAALMAPRSTFISLDTATDSIVINRNGRTVPILSRKELEAGQFIPLFKKRLQDIIEGKPLS